MSFSIFSMILISIVGTSALISAFRGMKKGLTLSLLSLATFMFSTFAAMIAAVPISDPFAEAFYGIFKDSASSISAYFNDIPSLDVIITAFIDAFITPFVFVLSFAIIYPISAAIVKIIYRYFLNDQSSVAVTVTSAPSPHPDDAPDYSGSNSSSRQNHRDKLLGGIISGVCGFLIPILILSPLLGTLSTLNSLDKLMDANENSWESIGISNEAMDSFEIYINDGAVATLGFVGGNAIFNSTAVSSLPNGKTLSIKKEVDALSNIIPPLVTMLDSLSQGEKLSVDDQEFISGLSESISRSEILSLLTRDILNSAASSWRSGKSFLNIKPPLTSDYIRPVLDEVLLVCATATDKCAVRDLQTLLNIYQITTRYNINSNTEYNYIEELLKDGEDLFRELRDELEKNPCMSSCLKRISDISLDFMASMITDSGMSNRDYEELINDISNSYNLINQNNDYTSSEKAEQLSDLVIKYTEKRGIYLPEDFAELAVSSLISNLEGSLQITPEELDDLLKRYSAYVQ